MNGIDFNLLKCRWGNGRLDKGFDIIQEFLERNPDSKSFYTTDMCRGIDPKYLAEFCVALQTMTEDNLAKYQYQVVDNGFILPEIYDEIKDIPEDRGQMDLKMIYTLV